MSYYPLYRSSSNSIKVKLDFTNFATKDEKMMLKILLLLMLVVMQLKLI